MGTITDVRSITAEGCISVSACASIPRAELVVRQLLHTQTLQKTARPLPDEAEKEKTQQYRSKRATLTRCFALSKGS